jgi:hypothetical protein
MPGFFCPGRPGGEHDEPLLDMIFDGRAIPPDAPQEMHDLERMLAALAGPAEPGELAGEAAAWAAFIRVASPASVSPVTSPAAQRVPGRPASHRLARRRAARRRAGLPAAWCTAAAVLAGAAAAYAGVLPDPVQQVAHVTVGAPAPHHHRSPAPARSGPGRGTRHRPGPGGPPAHRPGGLPAHRPPGSADAARSPGPVRVVKPRPEPHGTSPQPTPSCGAGSWAYQGLLGIRPGVPPPSLKPFVPRCRTPAASPPAAGR